MADIVLAFALLSLAMAIPIGAIACAVVGGVFLVRWLWGRYGE